MTSFVHGEVAEVVASPQVRHVYGARRRGRLTPAERDPVGPGTGEVVKDGGVFLDLAPFIEVLEQGLRQAGLTAVTLVPEVHPPVKIADARPWQGACTGWTRWPTRRRGSLC